MDESGGCDSQSGWLRVGSGLKGRGLEVAGVGAGITLEAGCMHDWP